MEDYETPSDFIGRQELSAAEEEENAHLDPRGRIGNFR
jgi:hypothetical protein